MKAKKIIALAMSAAMLVGTAACLSACTPGNNDDGDKGGVVEDTRIWYAVGRNTKGTLSKFDNFYPQENPVEFERDKKDESKTNLTIPTH